MASLDWWSALLSGLGMWMSGTGRVRYLSPLLESLAESVKSVQCEVRGGTGAHPALAAAAPLCPVPCALCPVPLDGRIQRAQCDAECSGAQAQVAGIQDGAQAVCAAASRRPLVLPRHRSAAVPSPPAVPHSRPQHSAPVAVAHPAVLDAGRCGRPTRMTFRASSPTIPARR